MNDRRDNPWALAGLLLLAVTALLVACMGWVWILTGPVR